MAQSISSDGKDDKTLLAGKKIEIGNFLVQKLGVKFRKKKWGPKKLVLHKNFGPKKLKLKKIKGLKKIGAEFFFGMKHLIGLK